MFIETNTEKLINLYLLQDIRKSTEDGEFNILFIHTNGEVYKESYESEAAINMAFDNYKTKLLGE